MKLSGLIVIISVLSVTNSAIISSVNSAFEVFGPSSLVRFFEFNDQGWNITSECVKDMYSYLDALQRDLKWAYKCKCVIIIKIS